MSVIVQTPRSRSPKALVAGLASPHQLSTLVDRNADAPDYRVTLDEALAEHPLEDQPSVLVEEKLPEVTAVQAAEVPPVDAAALAASKVGNTFYAPEDESEYDGPGVRHTVRDRRKATQGRKTIRAKAQARRGK